MAPPSRKRFRVKEGNLSILISPWRGKWRFRWRKDKLSTWAWVTKPTKDEAAEAAVKIMAAIENGTIDWASLDPKRRDFLAAVHREASPQDQQAILDFIAARKKSGKIADAVPRFMAHKIASKKGIETEHLGTVRRDLEDLAKTFPETLVVDLSIDQLTSWWNERTGSAGDARRSAIRGNAVMFWNWCQEDGIGGNDRKHTAHRLPTIDPGDGKLEILEIAELEYLLSIIEPQWFPLVILGAFQGIRPEELAPKKKRPKPRLQWEHINWEFDSIGVPKRVSKGGKRPRTLPLHPVTRAWLEAYGIKPDKTGPICTENPGEVYVGKERVTTLWGKALAAKFPDRFTEWPADALRHSYASYRQAIVQNLGTVASEMGNSEAMLHGHYNNPRRRDQGEAWFDFTPDKLSVKLPYLKAA